ncbi:hypothetical protein [Akkermansia glycaniphila]|uniref:Prokaryotic membrane lipoprotein lipid attachment site profile n=1 Tax=Akkermansia glycaniphila TaxID=1679444 RepID=A0A1H6L2Q9_9BACT|nr:hypothetical protein [Akkermansia glycaniphila]SEH82466.1 Hypothetical protein PYTT_1020 [Akkermansia glycaniphila]
MKTISMLTLASVAFVFASCQQQQQVKPVEQPPVVTIQKDKK